MVARPGDVDDVLASLATLYEVAPSAGATTAGPRIRACLASVEADTWVVKRT
ncbi:MAG: hypothetical protein WAV45_15395 [Propionibacteriaceae bacterium]